MMNRIAVLGGLVFLVPSAVFSAGMNGAHTLGRGKASVGLEQEIVTGRRFETLTWSIQADPVFITEDLRWKTKRTYRSMAVVRYGLLDSVELTALIGLARPGFEGAGSFDYRDPDHYTGHSRARWRGEYGTVFGAGVKHALRIGDRWLLGLDGQYLTHRNAYHTTLSCDVYSHDTLVGQNNLSRKLSGKPVYAEWHVAPFVGAKTGGFTSYVGIRYSQGLLTIREEEVVLRLFSSERETKRFRTRHPFGAYARIERRISPSWKASLDGRLINERALSFGMQAAF